MALARRPFWKMNREFHTLPFRTIDLIADIEERLRRLRDEKDPELRLPGLKVRQAVFVLEPRANGFPRTMTTGVLQKPE